MRLYWPRRITPVVCAASSSGEVKRAHCALGPDLDIQTGDIRDIEFGAADAVVILDVLHHLAPQAQCDLLNRVRAALPAGGLLLLRVCDADSGLRYRYTRWVDQIVMLLRGHACKTPHCRSVAEWQSILRESGFETELLPMSQGTLFANVLLIAHAR